MKHFIIKFVIFLLFFSFSFSDVFANEAPAKISGLIFDNSDAVIYIDTQSNSSVTFSKGYLKNPDRIYLDINNAILTTPKKTYTAKYSVFNNIKISQFTLEPKTVRIVFEYNEGLDLSAFQVYKSENSIFIKTKKSLLNAPAFKTVYSNSKTTDRSTFYQGVKFEETGAVSPVDLIQNENAPKNEITAELTPSSYVSKIPSKYFIKTISKEKNGIMVSGLGKLSLIPSFTLTEPDRLIIDLDDAVLSTELRNKSFIIGGIEENNVSRRDTIKFGQNAQSIVRMVITGPNAKEYRGIVSPDAKSFYITNKANIIASKMSDNNANLLKSEYTNANELETVSLFFDDSIAFNVFEQNSNLYLDINNLNAYDDTVLMPLVQKLPNLQTIRLALDKLRIVIPNTEGKYISLKTNPDNDQMKIYFKATVKKQTPKPAVVVTPVVSPKKQPEISNLYTVVIDAGHGGSDVGATRNNIYEKDITLKIAKMVEKNLGKKNVKTYMTRDKDKTVSLEERSNFSNEKNPDLFVSIHVNSSLNDDIYGIETHWYKEDSKKYAAVVHEELQKKAGHWKTNDRGLFNSKFYVINHTEAPAILCEIGFISNKDERSEITKTKRQEEIAEAISEGIYKYLKARK